MSETANETLRTTDELNEHTQQTVDNVQQTVATMNQMAASVKQNLPRLAAAINFHSTGLDPAIQGGRR